MTNFFDDVRFGLRMLRKNPGFATGAILTMTLGIGANTAVFSVVNAVLFRSLPGVSQAERLVSMSRIQNGAVYDNFSLPDYKDYSERNRSFSGIAAHVPAAVGWNDSSPERLGADLVTDNYFAVLGVQPAAGRLLAADDRNGIVISYSLWLRKFGGADVVGKSVTLDGAPFTIVGVAHKDFRGTVVSFPFDVWAPLDNQTKLLHLSGSVAENRSAGWLQLFGRLKAGVDLKQADVEIKTIAAQLGQAYPLTNNKRSASIASGVGIFPDDRAEVTGLLGLLAAAVVILLLIGCANVAGLLVIRAAGRTREIAIRIAVGAGRGRIVRQLLTEGFVLALIAGSAAVFFASSATEAIINLSQGSAPSILRHAGAQVDGRVLAFTFAISIATGVLFALLPALQTLKVDVNVSLKSGSPGAGFSKSRLRSVLVMGQVALSFALLSAAALLLGGLYKIIHANPGFDASHVAIAPIDLSLEHYSESQGRQFYDDLVAKLSAAPDIEGASLATSVPPAEFPGTGSIFHPGEEPSSEVFQARSFELGLQVNLDAVAPNYFHTLKIPIVAGRDFSKADRGGAPNIVIVSRRLAETMWPHENPIGKRIAYPQWGGPRRAPFEVVGVAADVKHRSLAGEFTLMLYIPLFVDGYSGRANIVVRTREDAAAGIAEIRQAASQLDSRLPVYFSETGDQHSADSLWQQRMAAAWIGAFSLLALGLAAMGLYVVISQSVAQRAREMGIRIALGATRANVVELIMKQALPLALAGIAAGIPAAMGFDRLMKGKLEGIVGAPLPVFFGISVLLIIVMIGAIWIPARRATRIDPIQALRCD